MAHFSSMGGDKVRELMSMVALGLRSSIVGPLREGHLVRIGGGLSFFVPPADFEAAQRDATETGSIQFLGITVDGEPLRGDREAVLYGEKSAGLCAWIMPIRGEDKSR